MEVERFSNEKVHQFLSHFIPDEMLIDKSDSFVQQGVF